jgi:hypothetical protein
MITSDFVKEKKTVFESPSHVSLGEPVYTDNLNGVYRGSGHH